MVECARFHKFAKFSGNPLIDLLYNERLRQILHIMNLKADKKSIVLDLGCGTGHFSRVLSFQSLTIGLDIDKRAVVKAQKRARALRVNKSNRLHFVVADVFSLPFPSHSVNAVVCASVLEHIEDLDGAVKEIKGILKKDGILVVGYPVETKLFKFVWRLVSPQLFTYIDQSQTFWYDPRTHKQYCYWECPFTHKQDYQTIRDVLRKYFRILQKDKLPFNILPDLLSYYECIRCACK